MSQQLATPSLNTHIMLSTPTLETRDTLASSAKNGDSSNAVESPVPTRMRAIVQQLYGDADTLQLSSIDVPQPTADQVLLKVEAAGLDRGVWHLMTGLPWLVRIMGFGLTHPKQPVPGLDVSGRVVKLGSDVTDFQVGDAVFGVGTGTFADYAVANVDKLSLRADELDPVQVAAVPISGMTALQALRDVGQLQSGQRVLVIGASGGVGSYTVQLARYFGAMVSGVASTGKLDYVRHLGAEHVIDYTCEDALDGSVHYDLIIDIGGRNPVGKLRRALTADGTLVIVGGEGGDRLTGGVGRQLRAMLLSPFVSQRLTSFVSGERGEDVRWLGERLVAGDIKAPVDKTYTLEMVPSAVDDLAAGRLQGKAVIQVVS